MAKRRGSSSLATRARNARHRAEIAEQNARAQAARLRGRALKELSGRLPGDLQLRSSRRIQAASGQALGLGSYDNATRTRLRSGSRPRGGAAWSHLDKATRDALRRDCQGLKRNNVVARTLINRHVDFVVGDGAVVKPTTTDAAWNAEVARLWNQWAEGCDPDLLGRPNIRGMTNFWQDCRAIVGAWLTDGDILAVEVLDAEGRTTLQYVESERLINEAGAYADTERMVGGVEMDERGAVVAYHVGQWDRSGSYVALSGTYRVPAESAMLLPNPVGFEAGQVRGEPALQAALDWFDVLNGFIESTAVAAEVATYLGLIFKSERPAEFQSALEAATLNQPDRASSDEPREVQFGPAFTLTCRPGETVEQVKPEHPTTQFKDFVFTLVQLIGADLAVPLLLALYVSDGLSYSNLRGVMAIAARSIDFKQGVLAGFVSWVYRRKVAEWMRRGLVGYRDDWDKHTVKFPPAPVVDFKTEAEAYEFAIRHNLMSKAQAVELLGTGVLEEIIEANSACRKMEAAAGVLPPDMPGASRPGNPPPRNGGTDADAPNDQHDKGDTDPTRAKATEGEGGERGGGMAVAKGRKTASAEGGFLVGDKTLAHELVSDVATKRIPPDSARAILTERVGLDEEQASKIVTPAEAFTPAKPEPAAAPQPQPAGATE